jgi:hypothetical protein
MLEKLAAAGVDVSQITDVVPDSVVADMCRLADGPADDFDDDADPSTLSPDDAAKMKEMAVSNFKKYAERCRKMGESDDALKTYLGGVKMPTGTPAAQDNLTAEKFSERVQPLIDAAVNAAVKRVESQFAPIQKQVHDFEANTKRASVEKFCEAMSQAGKIIPAEMDRGADGKQPTIVDRLLRADAHQKVHKFSEGGKTHALSELDLQMREIERRPVLVKFGERRVGTTKDATAGDDEKAKVEGHYEQFAEEFAKGQTTKEDFLKAFESARKSNPKLTAEKFLNPKAAV